MSHPITRTLKQAKVHVISAHNDLRPVANFKEYAQLDIIKAHSLTDNPDEADIILFIEDITLKSDYYFRKVLKHPLLKRYRHKSYMYNPRDFPWYVLPGLYACLPQDINNSSFTLGSPYLENINPFIEYEPSIEPEYLFSFYGALSSPVREKIIHLTHPRASIKLSTHKMYDGQKPQEAQQEYASLLSNSKFVLCPRGISSSSIRLFETLKAGRVPVVLSDKWIRPVGCDWDKFVIFVSEENFADIPAILEKEEAQWLEKSRIARKVWEELFSPQTIFNYFINCLLQLNPQQPMPVTTRYKSTLLFLDYFIHNEYRNRIRPYVHKAARILKRP
jgi:hypothetical protein